MSSRIFDRLYRVALAVYPRRFRERFGDEMREFARLRMRDAERNGPAASAREATGLVGDLLVSASRQWISTFRSTRRAARQPIVDNDMPRDTMDILLQDLRFAMRGLVRRPAFTIVAALTLALGIGANAAIFSVVNAVLIRPLPYEHPDRLVLVWGTQGAERGQGVVYADYVDWGRQTRAFEDLGAFRGQSVNLTGGATPERLVGSFVSASFLRVINAKLSQGRAFTEGETEIATKAPVAIVSHEAWVARFGSDSGLLGRSIVINGTSFTVIGITAPKMAAPLSSSPPDVMMPIGYYPNAHGLDRGTRGIAVVGRMKPGVTVGAAQRDLQAIELRLAAEYPTTNAGTSAEVVSLKEFQIGAVKSRLYILFAAVVAVLLIACANVANLQLARGASRSRELSVRAALGAGRWRIAQQLLTESVLLALLSGVAGALFAVALTKGLVALIGPSLPVDETTIHIDGPVLLFALAVSLTTGIIFGLPPAWKASRTDLADMLRSRVGGALGHVGTRNALVVVQLALSLALLASAGLLTRSLLALERVDPGFDGSHLLTAQFRLPAAKYDSPEKIWAMFDRTVTELRSVPGVQAAALVRASPLSGNGESYPVILEGAAPVAASEMPSAQVNSITTQYLSTMRIPILAGRDIAESDRSGASPVVLVNKTLAERTWPGQSPLGKRVKFGDDDWRIVVGVVGDTRHFSMNEPQLLQAYVPHAQRPQIFTSIVVRTAGNPLDFVKPVREALWRVDRDQPIWRFRSMQQDLDAVVTSPKTTMWLIGLFALVALLVAAVGTYGVLSYTMTQRTQEVGIRIALGADAHQVTRMVVREGARLVTVAVLIGLLAAFGAARLLRSQLFGVASHDVLTFGVVTVVLSGVALLACYLPARRASRVDPMVALRSE